MSVNRAAVILLALAGCDPGTARVSAGACEDVLAHLVVLERDAADPAMCPFHAKCEGSEHDQFAAQCPRVLTRRELGCYQRATTLAAANACLPLTAFAERITTGERVEPAPLGETKYGWSLRPNDQRAVMLGELERIRDAACACTDPTCLLGVGDRVDAWMSRFSSLEGDPNSTQIASRLFREVEACRSGKRGTLDAGVGLGGGGLPSCTAYLVLMERMASCPALPQTSRDSLRDNLPSLRDAYDGANMSDDVRKQMDDACAQALPSLQDQLRNLGCP